MSLVLTTYGRQKMIEAFWTPDIFVAVPTIYFCLTQTVPPSNAAGDELDEPDVLAGYLRVAYPLSSDHWTPTGFAEIYNNTEADFPEVTDEWGLIQGMAIADAAGVGTGNVIGVGTIGEPYIPEIGSTPPVEIGDITVGLYE